MAKNSVLGSPGHFARLPKQGFNLSHSLKFTSSCGHLLPIMQDQLRVGEKVRLNVNLFSRTQPLATAAMVDVYEFIDFFFVPMRKLYHNFDQLIMSVDDFNSVSLAQSVNSQSLVVFPKLNFTGMARRMVDGNTKPDDISVYGNHFDNFYAGATRLLDLLELCPNVFMPYAGDSTTGAPLFNVPENYLPDLNISSLLAYQAIYYDYYRLSNWEQNNNFAYNVDDFRNGDYINVTSSSMLARWKDMFSLRYRPYQRDYFKAIEPSPLLSPIGTLTSLAPGSLGLSSINQWLGLDDDYLTTNQSGVIEQSSSSTSFGDVLTNVGLQLDNNPGQLSLSSLRTAYAFEKLLKITNRAGKHYDDQVLAHFGFKVPRGISEEVYYLGSYNSKLTIGEVVSTADTSDSSVSNLAEIAGKGYNVRDARTGNGNMSDIDFVAPCDGILMAIYSCVPKLNYVVGLNRLHTRLTKYDFPQPELDNLGMQPLFGYQGVPRTQQAAIRVGWQYRYMESKVKYNRATHNFLGRDAYGQDMNDFGMQHDWTLAFVPFQSDYNFDVANWWDYLLCRPTDLNDIMLVHYNPALTRSYLAGDESHDSVWYNALYQRDPLIHDVSFKYYKTSFMSTFGLDDVDI